MAHRMAHFADKAHLDRDTLGGLNSALMLGLVGSGLAACVIGAFIYDVGRMFAAW